MKKNSLIETLEDFKNLKIGTRVYIPTSINIISKKYLGVNPIELCENYVMLMSSFDASKIEGLYLGNNNTVEYYTDYKEACDILYEKAKENVEDIKEIYLNNEFS